MAKKRASRPATRSYSMPELSSLYGEPPFEYREVKQLMVEFQTEPSFFARAYAPPRVSARLRICSTISSASGPGPNVAATPLAWISFLSA